MGLLGVLSKLVVAGWGWCRVGSWMLLRACAALMRSCVMDDINNPRPIKLLGTVVDAVELKSFEERFFRPSVGSWEFGLTS